jgi:hypothetical protein
MKEPGNTPIAIESVTIGEDPVQITCTTEIPTGAIVGDAVTSDGTTQPGLGHRWGQLRDSDPFVGATPARLNPIISWRSSYRFPLLSDAHRARCAHTSPYWGRLAPLMRACGAAQARDSGRKSALYTLVRAHGARSGRKESSDGSPARERSRRRVRSA